jgi:hypothetical protein
VGVVLSLFSFGFARREYNIPGSTHGVPRAKANPRPRRNCGQPPGIGGDSIDRGTEHRLPRSLHYGPQKERPIGRDDGKRKKAPRAATLQSGSQDAGLPDTNRRDPHKAGESPALQSQRRALPRQVQGRCQAASTQRPEKPRRGRSGRRRACGSRRCRRRGRARGSSGRSGARGCGDGRRGGGGSRASGG